MFKGAGFRVSVVTDFGLGILGWKAQSPTAPCLFTCFLLPADAPPRNLMLGKESPGQGPAVFIAASLIPSRDPWTDEFKSARKPKGETEKVESRNRKRERERVRERATDRKKKKKARKKGRSNMRDGQRWRDCLQQIPSELKFSELKMAGLWA